MGKYLAFAAVVCAGALGMLGTQDAISLALAPNSVQTAPKFQSFTRPTGLPDIDLPEKGQIVERSQQESAWTPAAVAATTAMVNLLGPVEAAHADIIKGRTASLIHPASMFAMLALSLWAGYLGLQWKRTRTIGQEITEVKNQATALAGRLSSVSLQGSAKETIAAMKAAGQSISSADLEVLNGVAALEVKVEELQTERKTLTAGNFRDRHFNAGSLILAVGVSSAIVAPVNTYLRTGKLFPGPHLYVGAAMVSLWAVAAALVPAMQKGNETARSVHVALNAVNTAFFLWQVGTGIEIVFKVLQFTSWP